MSELTESVTKMMAEFERLPGIGKKSAERITYHLLRVEKEEALALADSIRAMKENVRYCRDCFHLSEQDLCDICRDPSRDRTTICVLEQPRDLIALEQAGTYKGLYHVLLGRLAPLDGIRPENLTIEPLLKRLRGGGFRELIMATNPTVEGDATLLYITNRLEGFPIKTTRLARGLTSGGSIEFANKEMISDAITGRQEL